MSNLIEQQYTKAASEIQEDWFEPLTTKWYDYVTGLPEELQITYTVVILHNQVLNGGFHQYFLNGYGQFAYITIRNLDKIKAKDASKNLEAALDIVNRDNLSESQFRAKLLRGEISILFDSDELFIALENLDDGYYDTSDEVIDLLNTYLMEKIN